MSKNYSRNYEVFDNDSDVRRDYRSKKEKKEIRAKKIKRKFERRRENSNYRDDY